MFEELDKKDESKSEIRSEGVEENNSNIEGENIVTQNDRSVSDNQQEDNIEDIFSDGEDDLAIENSQVEEMTHNEGKEKPGIFSPINNDNNQSEIEEEKRHPLLKVFFLIIVAGLIIVGGYFTYDKYLKNIIFNKENIIENSVKNDNNENINVEDLLEDIIPENKQVEDVQEIKKDNSKIDNGKDTDGDGLSDLKEIELGLNINSIDTDQDGLFDREEVMVYMTNPKNKDTDGDGFSDGDEVKNGYNPNGAGKLYEIN